MADAAERPTPQRILGSKKGFYKVSYVPRGGAGAAVDDAPEPQWVPKNEVPSVLIVAWRDQREERASFKRARAGSCEHDGGVHFEQEAGAAAERAASPDASHPTPADPPPDDGPVSDAAPSSHNESGATPRKDGLLTSAVAAIRARFQSSPSSDKEASEPMNSTPTKTMHKRVRRPVSDRSAFTPQGDTIDKVIDEAHAFIRPLTAERDQLRGELEFVRTLYEDASSSAMEANALAAKLESDNALLARQVSEGVALHQTWASAQVMQWKDEATQLKAQLHLFQGQEARTSAETRRKAAEWDAYLDQQRAQMEQRQRQWDRWDQRCEREGLYRAEEVPVAPTDGAPAAPTVPLSASDELAAELAELAAEAGAVDPDEMLHAPRGRRRRAAAVLEGAAPAVKRARTSSPAMDPTVAPTHTQVSTAAPVLVIAEEDVHLPAAPSTLDPPHEPLPLP